MNAIETCTIYYNEVEYDCYTVFTPDGSVYGMSRDPYSPLGFNNYIGESDEYLHRHHLGEIVRLEDLEADVIKAITHRLEHENN